MKNKTKKFSNIQEYALLCSQYIKNGYLPSSSFKMTKIGTDSYSFDPYWCAILNQHGYLTFDSQDSNKNNNFIEFSYLCFILPSELEYNFDMAVRIISPHCQIGSNTRGVYTDGGYRPGSIYKNLTIYTALQGGKVETVMNKKFPSEYNPSLEDILLPNHIIDNPGNYQIIWICQKKLDGLSVAERLVRALNISWQPDYSLENRYLKDLTNRGWTSIDCVDGYVDDERIRLAYFIFASPVKSFAELGLNMEDLLKYFTVYNLSDHIMYAPISNLPYYAVSMLDSFPVAILLNQSDKQINQYYDKQLINTHTLKFPQHKIFVIQPKDKFYSGSVILDICMLLK
jgi:hypothetical protein